MARTPSPWYWPERNGWFTILNGQRQPLGPHPADAPPAQKRKGKWVAPPAITKAFHALLAAPEPQPFPKSSPTTGPTVAEVLDKFLDWCQTHRAGRTYDWYRDHLQDFLDHLGGGADMAVAELKPFHVIEWADGHADWSPAYKRGGIVAVQRPFNWAEEVGHIPASPVKKISKPQPQRRENPMSPEDFALLLSMVKEGDPFRDLLLFAWHSGCRPQEARHIEPRHVRLEAECVVIPKEEAKGKRRPRTIMLHGPALEVVARLMRVRTAGKLFLNAKGRPWKKFALCNRFDRLNLAIGMAVLKEQGVPVPPLPRFNRRKFTDKAQLAAARKEQERKLRDRRKQILKLAREHGKGLAAYDMRHGFAQRLLEGGANHMAVAELMGHSNGQMISAVYSHMNKATAHLKETLRKGEHEGAGG